MTGMGIGIVIIAVQVVFVVDAADIDVLFQVVQTQIQWYLVAKRVPSWVVSQYNVTYESQTDRDSLTLALRVESAVDTWRWALNVHKQYCQIRCLGSGHTRTL